MGFYTNFYNNKELECNDFNNRWSAKWAGGYDLWKWCWDNIEEKHTSNYFGGYFTIDLSTLEKMIEDNAMGKVNTNSVLRNLFDTMQEKDLLEIYFEGDY